MTLARGFWSYVHKDDEAEAGRIAQLARDVVAQYEMITGDSIDLFLDRDKLQWGDDWRKAVDGSLASTAFFIPVLTPRYFQSVECRRELNHFLRRAEALGLRELVMPILYTDFKGRHEDPPSDDAVALVKRHHWEDWTELRFASSTSPEYRIAVAKMASRLAEANEIADKANVVEAALALTEEDDDSPGVVDLMAQTESALPEWAETVSLIGQEISSIGELMQDATADINVANGKQQSFAARLTILRQVSSKLKEPADKIRGFGEQFTKQLNDVDQGVVLIIQNIPGEVESQPEMKDKACEFFRAIQTMAHASDNGLGSLKQLIDAIQPVEAMSRDLRAPLKTLRRGLTSMYEGREVINSWVELIDQSGLKCDGTE